MKDWTMLEMGFQDTLRFDAAAADRSPDHFDWSPPDAASMRHIPKAATPACAADLASILRQGVTHPESPSHWKAVLNWSGSVLFPAKRGGKRHNLTVTIKSHLIRHFSLRLQSLSLVFQPLSAR